MSIAFPSLVAICTRLWVALGTNPGCWQHGYDAARCCGPPLGGPCWGPDPDTHLQGRRSCCELGGYVLDEALAAGPREEGGARRARGCSDEALEARYHLPREYLSSAEPQDFVDDSFAGQAPVYGLALAAVRSSGLNHVIEVGGGGGEWSSLLIQQGMSLTLLDRDGPNFKNATARLRQQAGFEDRWEALAWDIDKDVPPPVAVRTSALAIAADVIEHLQKPRALLGFLTELMASGAARAVVLSTPDRDAFYDWRFHRGPPMNLAHVREWSAVEFQEFLRCEGMPLSALFEVEGTLVALLGTYTSSQALAFATSVWASPGAEAMNLRWRQLA